MDSFFLLKFLQNAGNCRFRGLTYAPDFKPGKVNLTGASGRYRTHSATPLQYSVGIIANFCLFRRVMPGKWLNIWFCEISAMVVNYNFLIINAPSVWSKHTYLAIWRTRLRFRFRCIWWLQALLASKEYWYWMCREQELPWLKTEKCFIPDWNSIRF